MAITFEGWLEFALDPENVGSILVREEPAPVIDKVPVLDEAGKPVLDENGKALFKEERRVIKYIYKLLPEGRLEKKPYDENLYNNVITQLENQLETVRKEQEAVHNKK